MKKILGLDLGTNSIGWALVESNFENKEGQILGMGSRIIPMSQDIMDKFGSGQSISQTAERTRYRGVRRLVERGLLRRERLHRVLNRLKFLPEHYADSIDFEKHFGQFKNGVEVKLNYRKNKDGKHEFLFMDSFKEMINEFGARGLQTKVPLDWTLYYLRKKALREKISKEELAWLLLNFNQKRGYYQLRGEEEEVAEGKIKEFVSLKVKEVIDSGDVIKKTGDKLYDVVFENGWQYDRQITKTENWIGKTKEFIVTTTTTKNGDLKYSFKAVDSEKDWIAIKTKTEQDIQKSDKTVGEYIFDTLLENPSQKLRGKLVKTIERKFYKAELNAILSKQIECHPELQDRDLYKACVEELYPINESHRNGIMEKGFGYLFVEDILFYQRPLKSKKSSIANCPYEKKTFVKDDVRQEVPIKCIPKSNPLFQEFRLWQFLKNLKIYQREAIVGSKSEIDVDVTCQFIKTEDDWGDLFDFLNNRKEIDQKAFLRKYKLNENAYRWNNVEDRKYPCNETRAQFISRLKKVKDSSYEEFLTTKNEQELWHLIYSVKDKLEYAKALGTFANRKELDEATFVESFIKFPPFDSDYGAYSEKAIKKLLPLMRKGKYWSDSLINKEVKGRILSIQERLESIDYDEEVFAKDKNNKLQTIVDDDIPKQLLKSFLDYPKNTALKGLNTYQACYAVYQRHSEIGDILCWKNPKDIDVYLHEFKQHSLRNPIVEQVVTETLRVVRDIWQYHGSGQVNFFNEIHVELGRDMKSSSDKRKSIAAIQSENENTNQRIKALLQELKEDSTVKDDVRPYSPSHQEILKIYEEGIFNQFEADDDILKIRKNTSPSKKDIERYKIWLEQGYISPYTGNPIPLSGLFSERYQIEHIIPQSRYFDNSLSNKVICESEVNEDKSNKTAYEYIKENSGKILNGSIKLLTIKAYEDHCNRSFKKSRTKLKYLLSEDIPEGFINRQLNDSRYISKIVKALLSNVVREEGEKEATAKGLVPVTGAITSKLKQDWGLNDKWNELITPRFKRLNEMTKSNDFGYWDKDMNRFRTMVPDEIAKGFSKKRIDHRHHALDALIIACVTKDHTNYITSLNTERKNHSLVAKLRQIEKKQITDKHTQKPKTIEVAKAYHQPWSGFTSDAKTALENILISFKQNTRVINKTNNKYLSYKDEDGQIRLGKDGKPKKELTKQVKGDSWAIRKAMHKDTVSGAVTIKRKKKGLANLTAYLEQWQLIVDKPIRRKVRNLNDLFNGDVKAMQKHLKSHPITINDEAVVKIEVYETVEATATRGISTALTGNFTRKQLEAVTDSGIQLIFENHIKNYTEEDGKERFDLAFNTEGLEDLNNNIASLNRGKFHKPIYKVRLYEVGNRFAVGETGNKQDKFVEAAKGTNLFFAIYWDEEKQKRVYDTVPLNEVITHQKQTAHVKAKDNTPIAVKAEKGQFLFTLSPNDLVYIPTNEELEDTSLVDFNCLNKDQLERVYKMVSTTQNKLQCQPVYYASSIIEKENGSGNKTERILKYFNSNDVLDQGGEAVMIKERCWKLKVDRLGNVIEVKKHVSAQLQTAY
ncbi:CRISPR-associated protein Csn1 [Ancylomarina euxinus]|uniref:CRISPR-associated endonuclease Cas9 n=1 Tax=Ancylomarina euxinus TaxID=2283627 RepID=A0A425Y3J4_9BACT|nr:type II CRISPR RNA-guided endonuclease Cas9 [Ancylomarina euxinus]MCZ4694460.1 type II CRISPR RNA-guided endonuclease Cas9 [Ancylomarina euxinus]MUP14003.1 CRISPR-associated protein Csn1 [Ancylomarina euxinus]RRG22865.1 CRISPR-associated protein Csn1 [Ancylomarina euxinus]